MKRVCLLPALFLFATPALAQAPAKVEAPDIKQTTRELASNDATIRKAALNRIQTYLMAANNGGPFLAELLKERPGEASTIIRPFVKACSSLKSGQFRLAAGLDKCLDQAKPVLLDMLDEAPSTEYYQAAHLLTAHTGKVRPELEARLTAKKLETRCAAAQILGRAADNNWADSLPALRKACDDSAAPMRVEAALAVVTLSRQFDESTVALLTAQYQSMDDYQQRETLNAVRNFGRRGTDAQLRPLLAVGRKDSDPERRCGFLLFTLGSGLEPLDELLPLLTREVGVPGLHVREQIVEALAHLGPKAASARPAVENWMAKATTPHERAVAAVALARLDPMQAQEFIPVILNGMNLKTGYNARRRGLIGHLGAIGPNAAAATPTLLKLLDDGKDVAPATTAVALLRIAPAHKERAYSVLCDVLNDKLESYDQEETWAGLGELGLPLLPDAIRALQTDPPSNLTKAVALLAAIGPPAKEALPLLEDRLAQLRKEAAARTNGIRERDDGQSTILRLERAIRNLRGASGPRD